MPWRTMDLREQRVRFGVAADRREKSMAELCREFDISRPAGYEWLRRYQQGGVEAIAERSRRPHVSPRRKDEATEQHVIALRQRYPDWGVRNLRVLLAEQGLHLAGCPGACPERSRTVRAPSFGANPGLHAKLATGYRLLATSLSHSSVTHVLSNPQCASLHCHTRPRESCRPTLRRLADV